MSEPAIVEDRAFYPRLVALTGCLCNELQQAGLTTCFCGLVVGNSVDLSRLFDEDSVGGMGWVRMVGIAPGASVVPGQSVCNFPLSATIEVGYAECITVPGADDVLSIDDELDGVRRMMAAMAATRRAAMCCDWGVSKRAISPSTWTPGGPEGGVVWGTWQFTMESP